MPNNDTYSMIPHHTLEVFNSIMWTSLEITSDLPFDFPINNIMSLCGPQTLTNRYGIFSLN